MAREFQDRVLDLVHSSLRTAMDRESCPAFMRRPGMLECGALWETISQAYHALTGLVLPDVMPSRERRQLDAIVTLRDGSSCVVEVDEVQHFNAFRALTLQHYPSGSRVAFDPGVWLQHSLASTKLRGGGWADPKPPLFPGENGRHRQRAFRDMLADLLPAEYGWAPTLRIAYFEVEDWLGQPDATERMSALLGTKTQPG